MLPASKNGRVFDPTKARHDRSRSLMEMAATSDYHVAEDVNQQQFNNIEPASATLTNN